MFSSHWCSRNWYRALCRSSTRRYRAFACWNFQGHARSGRTSSEAEKSACTHFDASASPVASSSSASFTRNASACLTTGCKKLISIGSVWCCVLTTCPRNWVYKVHISLVSHSLEAFCHTNSTYFCLQVVDNAINMRTSSKSVGPLGEISLKRLERVKLAFMLLQG